jgi:hypothetical protein
MPFPPSPDLPKVAGVIILFLHRGEGRVAGITCPMLQEIVNEYG